MPIYNDRIIDRLTSADVQSGFLVHFDFLNTPMRLWTGDGDLRIAADSTYVETWKGVGSLGRFTGVATSGDDLSVEEVKFSLSAASPALAQNFAADTTEALGRTATIYELFFDQSWAPIDGIAPIPIFEGRMGAPSIASAKRKQGEAVRRTMSVVADGIFANRNRPALQFWSDRDQRARSSDDGICERIIFYASGQEVVWPVFP